MKTSWQWLAARGDQLQLRASHSIAARAARENLPKERWPVRIGIAACATSVVESRHVPQMPHSARAVAARATARVLSRAPAPCRAQRSGRSGKVK